MQVQPEVARRWRRPERVRDAEHVTVYYDAGAYCGWPFNHGFWAFPPARAGDPPELLVGFTRGASRYQAPEDVRHNHVDATVGEHVTIRSTDGGRTWPREGLQLIGRRRELEQALVEGTAPRAPAAPLDWTAPDFCVTAGFGIPPEGALDVGYLQYSRDRGQTWEGPYRVPALGFARVQVKPDHVVRPDGLVLLFITVRRRSAAGDPPGSRFVAVYASPDGGVHWHYLSAIQATTPDAAFVNRYYACPVLLPDGRILAALRCQIDGRNAWPEVFESDDGGRTWRFLSRPSDWGGPTHLSRLEDGRLLAVYGYRVAPYGIRARVSEDEGRSWGPELVLRDDAGSSDLGYPRVVPLGGGRVMAAYYFNRADDPVQYEGGVRHIVATAFTP